MENIKIISKSCKEYPSKLLDIPYSPDTFFALTTILSRG